MSFLKINKIIIFFLFISLVVFHFFQLYSQHWSAVLDQDLIIIYNSLLFTSGLEQEYRDHPALTTFLIHSFFYNFTSFFLSIPKNIDQILISNDTENILQIYFYISRIVNFVINIFLILILSKVLKKINFNRNLRYLFLIIFILSSGYITSFFFLRSETLSLALFLVSVYFIFIKNRDFLFNSFISGVFFCLAMLSKIQIIFLFPYLLVNIALNNNVQLGNKKFINNYLIFSFFIGFAIYACIQFYLQTFIRFKYNHFIDLIFFVILFFSFFLISIFSGKVKNKLIILSSFLNGSVFLIILLLIFDLINLIHINEVIYLRLSNPIHYMTEFTGTFPDNSVDIDYLKNFLFILFSNYKFSFLELILIIFVTTLSIRQNKYILFFFVIFLFNYLIVNHRYLPTYHIYYMFLYFTVLFTCLRSIKIKKSLIITILLLSTTSINTLKVYVIDKNNKLNYTKIFDRGVGMEKICKEIKDISASNAGKNLEYIKYWHSKFDEKKLLKICDKNLTYYLR